jgi:hypothetical protein
MTKKSISPHSPIFQSGAPRPSFFARLPAPRGAEEIHQVQKMMIPAMFRRQPADVGTDIGRGNREQQQPAAFGEKFHMEKRLQQRKHHVTRFFAGRPACCDRRRAAFNRAKTVTSPFEMNDQRSHRPSARGGHDRSSPDPVSSRRHGIRQQSSHDRALRFSPRRARRRDNRAWRG